ncbi:hypothetical protein [Gimesia fumaroli]|uniref:Uncharacterized protein n=1 Tax=Gimesia fumaroli TaxID=2527976 RepID=A0A518IB13_9PLAN|nr:hypothetical protein [Gimesia fumaroli]QDV50284.1 hypothetical protein Enr17x_23220 [Gimesia fumaroli]
MTPEQLVQTTGLFYQSLIHPALDDPTFLADLDRFCQMRDNLDRGLALQLIEEVNWRDRLLGFAVAALLQDWSLSSAILETLQRRLTGMAIVPAGAWLVIQHQRVPEASPALILTRFDLTLFDGEVGWVLTRLQAVREGTFSVATEEAGPHSGQSFQDQLELYESLCESA